MADTLQHVVDALSDEVFFARVGPSDAESRLQHGLECEAHVRDIFTASGAAHVGPKHSVYRDPSYHRRGRISSFSMPVDQYVLEHRLSQGKPTTIVYDTLSGDDCTDLDILAEFPDRYVCAEVKCQFTRRKFHDGWGKFIQHYAPLNKLLSTLLYEKPVEFWFLINPFLEERLDLGHEHNPDIHDDVEKFLDAGNRIITMNVQKILVPEHPYGHQHILHQSHAMEL